MNTTDDEQRVPELHWPEGYPRTVLSECDPYLGDNDEFDIQNMQQAGDDFLTT